MKSPQQTVYVGLSGGVDSSVAAALLQQQGYTVVGAYMKNWTEDLPGMPCPWKDDLADARRVAAHLDIPLKILDFEQEYREQVVDAMVAEYQAGRTPNPDVWCNEHIKFKLFYDAARKAGADLIATGHYAQTDGTGALLKAKDADKDQTYFLYRISRDALRHTLFPVGAYTKPEIRALAKQFGLPTATKKDSQGICFVGQVGIRDFLAGRVEHTPGLIEQPGKGVVGKHEGAIFYTIGQRKGLDIALGKPAYVTAINPDTNTVVLGDEEDLEKEEMKVGKINWIKYDGIDSEMEALTKIRYKDKGSLSSLIPSDNGTDITVRFYEKAKGIAPGQSAVFYEGDDVIGGGIIQRQAIDF